MRSMDFPCPSANAIAYLLAAPEAERRGPLFRPVMPSGNRATARYAGQTISLIGAKAYIVVHTNAKTGRVKYASAHDLRRSFGTRWAKKVMPAVLQKLMGHDSIQTTMAYYVGLECDEVTEQLYGVGSVLGSVPPSGREPAGG